MANESKLSLKEMIRNRKTKKRLFEATLVLVYLLSLFIYQDYWIKLINFLWVDPIAGRFDASLHWIVAYSFLLVVVLIYYIITFFNERTYSLFRICLVSFMASLYFMYSINSVFDVFGLVIIGELLVFELIVILKIYFSEIKSEGDYTGLEFEKPLSKTKDKSLDDQDDYKRINYVKRAYLLLKDTFDPEIAFAVGISGKWGSGKSSFTNILKEEIHKEGIVDIVMEFKPWFCKSPNDIIEDFFNEYRYNISAFIPGLNSKLKFYMDTLQNVEIHNQFLRVSFKNFFPQKSSKLIYDDIIEVLKKASVKMVIIIDDLDRLDKDEILEVLRLIRNTANFPYTQFIVTYDKEYILETLPKHSKVDYNDFLMKIFNLEIAMPSFEGVFLCNELEKRLLIILQEQKSKFENYQLHKITHKRTENVNSKLKLDVSNANEDENESEDTEFLNNDIVEEFQIPKILNSKRDVIRFSNSFRLNLMSFDEKIVIDIDISDFFYLELLRYKFTNLYYLLRDNPLALLYINEKRYQIDWPFKDMMEPPTAKAYGEIDFIISNKNDRPLAIYILNQLFDSGNTISYNSISNVSNYFTYFANRLDSKNISLAEFISLLFLENSRVLQKMEDWYTIENKYKGQIEEKLIFCLEKSIPTHGLVIIDFDSDKIYGLIIYILEHLRIKSLEDEIRRVIINHINYFIKIQSRFLTENHIKKFIFFWLYFFDFIEEVDTNLNFEILDIASQTKSKWLIDDFQITLSVDTKSNKLGDKIYRYISRGMPDLKNVEVIVQIQYNRFNNYLFEINGIDSKLIDLYCYSVDSVRIAKLGDESIMSVKNYFREAVYKYPISFVNSNLTVLDNNLKLKVPLKKIMSNDEIKIFEKKVLHSITQEDNIVRAQNLWQLFRGKNYIEINDIPNADIYSFLDDSYDFQYDVYVDSEAKKLSLKIEKVLNNYDLNSSNSVQKRKVRDEISRFENSRIALKANLKTSNVESLDNRILDLLLVVPN